MIELRSIDEKNFMAVTRLKVSDRQQGFVASNVMSIAESKVFPHLKPRALYYHDELVGFVLYGRDPENAKYHIVRLMIDAAHQGKGLGKAATRALIDKMAELPGCNEIYLSFVPGNDRAEAVYLKIGFEHTGDIDEGEIVMRYPVGSKENSPGWSG